MAINVKSFFSKVIFFYLDGKRIAAFDREVNCLIICAYRASSDGFEAFRYASVGAFGLRSSCGSLYTL